MEPFTLGLLGSIIAPTVGGIVGNVMGAGDRERARELQEEAYQAIMGLDVPGIEEQKIALQKLVQQGELTPEALETILQQESEMKGISTDPRLKTAQMQALDRLSKQGLEGLTLQDRVALDEVRNQVESDTQARNKSILQDMAQRGMGGAGAELAMQMQSSQSGANRAKAEADRLAAMAQQRALEATMNAGRLGGEIRNTDFSEQERIASAQDAINRFNAANRQSVAQINVNNRNEAQAANLREAQRISDNNAALANEQEKYNKGLVQTNFNNRYNQTVAGANARSGLANTLNQNATQTQAAAAGVGQGVGQGFNAYGYSASRQPQQGGVDRAGGTTGYSTDYLNMTPEEERRARGMAQGGEVPGKAEVEGDHPANDKVPAMLSPGEVVIPRSVLDESDRIILDFIKKSRKGG